MESLYFFARFFPAVAIGVGVVLMQLAFFYRRRHKKVQFVYGGVAGVLFLFALVWFIFRGDLYSDQWVRNFLKSL